MMKFILLILLLLSSCGDKVGNGIVVIGGEYLLPQDATLTVEEQESLKLICDAFLVKKNLIPNSFKTFEFNIRYNYCSENISSMKAILKVESYGNGFRFVGTAENEATQFFTSFHTNTNGIMSSFCQNTAKDAIGNVHHASDIYKEVFSFKKQNCNIKNNIKNECFEKITLLKKNPNADTFNIIKVERLNINTDVNSADFGVVKKQIRHEECTQEGRAAILESDFVKF